MNTFVEIKAEEQLMPQSEEVILNNTCGKQDEENLRLSNSECTARMRELYADVSYVLGEKKVYLDASMNLEKLSRLLHTNTTYLSKVANICFGCNLKTLLNRYRVNHAKELLKNEDCDFKMLPMLCGFTSRSTFYAAFARFEHVTPKVFQNRYLSLKLRQADAAG